VKTLLVANRGEVAVRVFRTARKLGMKCVAVYSDADSDAMFVRAAHEAYRIGSAPASESYLHIERIIEAAEQAGADLIHPGYGFLAEDPEFARAAAKVGIVFVGPSPEVLELMGSKAKARAAAVAAKVPVVEGYAGEDQSDAAFALEAERIGFPLIVKPIAGGGGKGMSVARDPEQLPLALASARRSGTSAFGDDRLLIERYLEGARHVEVQVFGDIHGNVIHLGERDCTLQRRHQKILEESPSPDIDIQTRELLTASAVSLASAVGYVGAGTCEFIVAPDRTSAFLEMNARLQVEHPVTELVTGLDLVELQLAVAMGEALPLAQQDVKHEGHAIELRLYAEDPRAGFVPQAGRIEHLAWPGGVRIDTGVEEGSEISTYYDPMIAKMVASGPDRDAALAALRAALSETEILGVRTNLDFLRGVVSHPSIVSSQITTTWLEGRDPSEFDLAPSEIPNTAVLLAAAAEADLEQSLAEPSDPWGARSSWRFSERAALVVVLRAPGETVLAVTGDGPYSVEGSIIERAGGCHGWLVDHRAAAAARGSHAWFVLIDGAQYEVGLGYEPRIADTSGQTHLDAPMPGQVLKVNISPGDQVASGQVLVVVEAMKMEHPVRAPADGIVTAVLCAVGEQVDAGRTLVEFEAS